LIGLLGACIRLLGEGAHSAPNKRRADPSGEQLTSIDGHRASPSSHAPTKVNAFPPC